MGVVNVTPDSFSDGGLFLNEQAAIDHGVELVEQGAHILDVGGESTRPGAEPVGVEEELRRVVPVLEGLSQRVGTTQISIDTSKAAVAQAAIAAGATLVNDVSALRADPEMAGVVAASGADCCLMHMLGSPRTMQRGVDGSSYTDVVDEVKAFLEERMAFAVGEGIEERRILLDPGIGFGKTVAHNLELLRRLEELVALGRPVVVGTSRKSFLGVVASRKMASSPARGGEALVTSQMPGAHLAAHATKQLHVADRLAGTIATNVMALERGASVFRVHDVAPVAAGLAVASATLSGKWTASPTTS
ncbi:MAG: dihydropteroate synthase [Solirubrobacteraceae bacterium]